ncbi:MAG: hypothetical protein LYZ69_05295 [Nitrososphaerales archaeon]|nr:hypothetical protein [Nitrososphaerales archaeon]
MSAGGAERIGIHSVNLFDIVPGYVIVRVAALIVIAALVAGITSTK